MSHVAGCSRQNWSFDRNNTICQHCKITCYNLLHTTLPSCNRACPHIPLEGIQYTIPRSVQSAVSTGGFVLCKLRLLPSQHADRDTGTAITRGRYSPAGFPMPSRPRPQDSEPVGTTYVTSLCCPSVVPRHRMCCHRHRATPG